ncbi:MAG: carbonic anhydrase [Deltaproteobacteria bacterium]
MHNLLPGLRKFTHDVFPELKPEFESLSKGQTPHTLFITCSDSRVVPNLLTQTQPGEIFLVRNAGNIVPPFGASRGGEEAAIEFAIDGLKVTNIVICGHSHCGAMAAFLSPEKIQKMPSVRNWLEHAAATKRRLEAIKKGEIPTLLEVTEENVLVQADNLKTHPSVSAALREKRIRIYGWVYHFETGVVMIYDPLNHRYVCSSEVKEEASKDATRFCLA